MVFFSVSLKKLAFKTLTVHINIKKIFIGEVIFMLVLNRKRISIVILCIMVSIFSFMIATTDKEESSIPTTATPVSGKTIVIDAGHGVPDERSTK